MTKEQRQMAEKNHNLIYAFLRLKKLSTEDWYDIAAIGLCKAALNYKPDKGCGFSHYAYSVMTNEVRTEMRKYNALVRKDKDILYYDDFIKYDNCENEKIIFLNTIEDIRKNTEDEAIVNIMYSKLKKYLENIGDKKYYDILKLLSLGYSQSKIANVIGCSQPQVSIIIKMLKEQFNKCI